MRHEEKGSFMNSRDVKQEIRETRKKLESAEVGDAAFIKLVQERLAELEQIKVNVDDGRIFPVFGPMTDLSHL